MSILLAIIVFGLLILSHEWGHFKAARNAKVRVDEFGIGFPPKVWGKKVGDVLYSINLLPIGGFVKIAGENYEEVGPDSFVSATYIDKMKILLAGVVINFATAWLIFTYVLAVQTPNTILPFEANNLAGFAAEKVDETKVVIVTVLEDSPADSILGLIPGDRITEIDGTSINTLDLLSDKISENAGNGKEVSFKYFSSGEEKQSNLVIPEFNEETGSLGISYIAEESYRYSWWQAPIAAGALIIKAVLFTLETIYNLIASIFTSTESDAAAGVTGPVGIINVFKDSVNFGYIYVLSLIGSIALSLGIMNALPIPALDGGRAFILTLRQLGLNISYRFEQYYHGIGMIVLLGLMLLITLKDVNIL